MKDKLFSVVDSNNIYKTFVTVDQEQDDAGNTGNIVVRYKLSEGERLLDAKRPKLKENASGVGFVKPRWDEDTAAWGEGASAEELAAWEAEHPAPAVDLDMLRAAKQEQNKQALAD